MTPSQLYSRILVHTPNCPTPMVDQAVMDTVIDFVSETGIELFVENPIPLVNGQAQYTITEPTGTRVSQITRIVGTFGELIPVTPSRLQDLLPDWQTSTSTDPRFYSTWPDPNVITVYPTPANVTDQVIRVFGSWKPRLDSTSFPDRVGEDYFDPIVCGTLSRLMMMPDRKWTNPNMAAYHEGRYNNAVVKTRIEALHAKTPGSLMIRPRRFGS